MIRFDHSKMRSVYVYILKITTSYVYVTTHRTGEPYTPKGSNQIQHNGYAVTRVPISQTVYTLFKKYSSMTEFSKPRLAALNFYGSTIVSIETQQYSRLIKGFQSAENWKSYFARSLADLRSLTEGKEAYIDGQDIYWFTDEDHANAFVLDRNGAYAVVNCEAVRLGNLGRPLTFKALETAESQSYDEKLEKLSNHYHLRVRTASTMRYCPEATGDLEHDNINLGSVFVYSGLVADMRLNSLRSYAGDDSEQKESRRMIQAIIAMCNPDRPSQANLDFLIRAARTVGGIYGMDQCHFLNVPGVMKATRQMNLMDIPERQRSMICIGRSAQEAIGWLFRFIYMEDDLDILRRLVRCMRQCMRTGLMPYSEDSLVYPERAGEPVPLIDVKSEMARLSRPSATVQDYLDRVEAA